MSDQDEPRKHGTNGWISNTVFKNLTGIRRICWDCGAGDPPRGSVCPGKRPIRQSEAAPTHGRHCPCSACARQDWSEPGLAHCGMHGSSCPPAYQPSRSQP